jgi:hypothetical protein
MGTSAQLSPPISEVAMGQNLFTQNVIAIIWDFDKTLTPKYMQAPLFRSFGVDEAEFWAESNGLEEIYRARGAKNVSKDSLYLNHILTYVREGVFAGLSNERLFELGKEIEFYEGLPEFLADLKAAVAANELFGKHGVTLEHYVVSTGLRQMIMGSRIAKHVDGVWGCEFVEGSAKPYYLKNGQPKLFPDGIRGVITDIAYAIDNTTKTRAIFEINKGANKHPEIDVNASLSPEDRRVPFQNMIYVADGPSDVPSFSIVNQYGGRTFAVYEPKNRKQFEQVNRLQRENRVQGIGEASYIEGALATLWLFNAVEEIGAKIVDARQAALREKAGAAPKHILSDLARPPASSPSKMPVVDAVPAAEKKPPASEPGALPIRTASER